MAISKQLRSAVTAAKLSGNELAKRAKLPQPTVSRWLSGRTKRLGLDAVDKIAKVLDLELTKVKRKPR